MKTVSTKLDNKLHEQFSKLCNNEGKCQSEFLREIIQNICEDCEEIQQIESKENPKPTITLIEDRPKIAEVKNIRIVEF